MLPKTPLHAFVLPFYDTNIAGLLEKPQHRGNSEVCAGALRCESKAHGIMQMGTMNPMQNYQMQALLRPGHWAQDRLVGLRDEFDATTYLVMSGPSSFASVR